MGQYRNEIIEYADLSVTLERYDADGFTLDREWDWLPADLYDMHEARGPWRPNHTPLVWLFAKRYTPRRRSTPRRKAPQTPEPEKQQETTTHADHA